MIGVVADDLTGAAEIAAVGLRYGLRAEVMLEGKPGQADLVCFDTDSRSHSPKAAARRAASAAETFSDGGVHWVYKKVDSVLRGHVTAEIEAIAKQLRAKRILLVPANPSLGRTIRSGAYFINRKPLDQTEFARDPEYPRRSANVLELLGPTTLPIQVCQPGDTLPKNGIIVGEAESPADLERWASRRTEVDLLAGGAEFFAALLSEAGYAGRRNEADDWRDAEIEKKLIISGTNSDASREFIEAAKKQGTPVFSLQSSLAQGAQLEPTDCRELAQEVGTAFDFKRSVILQIGLPQVTSIVVARRLATYLVQVAEEVLRENVVKGLYVEGGATATELVRRMGWTRLRVLRELAPGVVTLAPATAEWLTLTIKPGSYAWGAAMDELKVNRYNLRNA